MAISLTKEKMEELFLQYLATIFGFPEVVSCCAKEVVMPESRHSSQVSMTCTVI